MNPAAMAREVSPSNFCFCPQDELEPILRVAAQERGGDLRFSTEMVDFEQDDDGVTVTVLERISGARRTVHADYLIATDGARSSVRQALQITTSGKGALEHYLNIYFLADLTELVRGRTFSQCWIENADVRGLFLALNNTDRWAFHLLYSPEKGEKPEDFPPPRCLELLHKAIGVADLAIEHFNSITYY